MLCPSWRLLVRGMKWLSILAALIVGAVTLAGYFILLPNYTNRFRLTIEIETPDGIKAGSSVIETTFWESGSWGPVEARGVRSSATGEAVFVDLGRGKNLLAILGFGPSGTDDSKIFGLTRAALALGKTINWKDEYRLKGKGELPSDYIPTLITFADINDPRTARTLKPSDFSVVYGPGFGFRRALIETTTDPVTRGIDKKLP
jgi:hypothetical protein